MKSATALAIDTGTTLARAGCKVIQMKSSLEEASREPAVAIKRSLRKARYAAEDLSDEMVLAIRKQPLQAIGITFGLAFVIGALTGGWMKRKLS